MCNACGGHPKDRAAYRGGLRIRLYSGERPDVGLGFSKAPEGLVWSYACGDDHGRGRVVPRKDSGVCLGSYRLSATGLRGRGELRFYLLPCFRFHKAGEMVRVGGGYDHSLAFTLDVSCLGGEDHIGIERWIWSGGLALLASLRPQLGSSEHGPGSDGTISDGFLEFVQTLHAALTAGAQELAAHLVVGDLGDENGDVGREESFKPLYDLGVDLLGIRVGNQPQRARVQ